MSRKASRRSFLKESALLGAAYYIGSAKFSSSSTPSVIVVGAGAFGGWTALHLLQRGARVTLLDAWGPGNSRASSGGETRTIRATYGPAHVLYVKMVSRAATLARVRAEMESEALLSEWGAPHGRRGRFL